MQTTDVSDLTSVVTTVLQTLLTFLLDFFQQVLAAFLF